MTETTCVIETELPTWGPDASECLSSRKHAGRKAEAAFCKIQRLAKSGGCTQGWLETLFSDLACVDHGRHVVEADARNFGVFPIQTS